MKLTKRVTILLACTTALTTFAACGGNSDDNDGGDGDGDATVGDGDGDGDIGTGDGDTGVGGAPAPGPTGPQCDEPGGAQCTGSASGLVCAEGSTDAATFVCATGEVCQDGACVGQCDPGATECVGGQVQRVCTADGREWVQIPCQNGDVCEDGACGLGGGLVCVPGAKDCGDDGMARTCKEDGSGWDEAACPGTSECSSGECVGTVCTVGESYCDSVYGDIPRLFQNMMLGGGDGDGDGGEPNWSAIYRCVDGSGWVADQCPSDGDVESWCHYEGVDAAAAARYRIEASDWILKAMMFGGPGGNPSLAYNSTLPTPPAIPDTSKAYCAPVGCDPNSIFFETPSGTRQCGDYAEGEDPTPWTSFTQCNGIPPYSEATLENAACSGLTACGMANPQLGCVATDCLPGESMCQDDSSYQWCSFNSYYPSDSYFPSGEANYCPESGACTDSGEAPDRAALCDGEAVLPPL